MNPTLSCQFYLHSETQHFLVCSIYITLSTGTRIIAFIYSQLATRMHSHDNQRDIGLFTHCGKTCMMAASGCTRQRNVLWILTKILRMRISLKWFAHAQQYQSGGQFDQMKTLGLPCCLAGYPLSCEWTLELLLNDKSNKPGVYNSSHPRSVCRLCAKSGGYPGCMLTPVQLM